MRLEICKAFPVTFLTVEQLLVDLLEGVRACVEHLLEDLLVTVGCLPVSVRVDLRICL